MKNNNWGPRRIAIISSIISSFCVTICLIILKNFSKIEISKFSILLVFILILVIGYFIFFIALEFYILKKIKIIYKHISQSKTSNKDTFKSSGRISENVFNDAEQDIELYTNKNRQQLSELRKMEKYRQEFLANLSHELKTPIFNIQGYVETLIDGGINDTNINVKYLQKASNNIDRLSALVSDIDLISKLEEGVLSCKLRSINIKDSIENILESNEFLTKSNDAKIFFDPLQFNQNLIADEKMIKQVIVNLLTNAIKYNPNDIKEIKITAFDMEDKVLIEISDNGMGIEQKHIPRLFERFYRIDSNRSREQGGTGLGLSIVKHIIEAHNQTLNVRSSVGIGSTFGFTLSKA